MNTAIYYLQITNELNSDIYQKLTQLVSSEKMQKLGKLKQDIDKKLSLYAEILLKLALQRQLGLNLEDIQLDYDEMGKPFIKNHPKAFVSIAHSGNRIAVAVSQKPIGIDIEKLKTANLKIAKRFFTPEENKIITTAKDISSAFFTVWTKKEAYLKCLGTGLRQALNSFSTIDDAIKGDFFTIKEAGYIISAYGARANKAGKLIPVSESEIEKLTLSNIVE